MYDNERIARNAMLMYFRMAFMMCVSLYTSRIVIKSLGVDDYGIYNVVGGFVAMFSFLNGALSTSTSRYITYALGTGNSDELADVFVTSKLAHILIALFVLLVGETLGLWFVQAKMQIPPDRMTAALWVYQCSIITSVIMIWSVPYNAMIIAYEHMSAFAYISVLEAVMKLLVAYFLVLDISDRLVVYAVLLMILQILIRIIYTSYCDKQFEVARARFAYRPALFKKLFSFAAWNLWGGLASVLFSQGINVLLNIFFGPIVNAARGVSVTIQAAVQQFSKSFQTALNPQITKTYAFGDYSAMHVLICRSSKFSFLLLFCASLPILLETEFVLKVWLTEIPEYAPLFIRIMLWICIIDAMANPFMTAAAATGNIKLYQSVVGGLLMAIVPIAYVVLLLGGKPASVFYVQLIVFAMAFIARMYIISSMICFSVKKYVISTLSPCLLVGVVSSAAMCMLKYFMVSSLLNSIVIIGVALVFTIIVAYIIGLTRSEQLFVKNKVTAVLDQLYV